MYVTEEQLTLLHLVCFIIVVCGLFQLGFFPLRSIRFFLFVFLVYRGFSLILVGPAEISIFFLFQLSATGLYSSLASLCETVEVLLCRCCNGIQLVAINCCG